MIKKFIAVLGGGESGVGAAALARSKGMDVLLSDSGTIAPKYKLMLDERGIAWEEGGHSVERILTADEIVKSPGIPLTAPLIVEAVKRGIPVISEIELAGRYSDARMVCITGSNGKTTTTSLIHHILTSAGVDAGLAGNIGQSLALQVAEQPHSTYVVELSSFQLDNMYDFRTHIAVLLNITPDHLDRYDHKMENYAAAKMRITLGQQPDDAFIYWADDPVTRDMLPKTDVKARQLTFVDHDAPGHAAWVDGDALMHIAAGSVPEWTMPVSELSLPGIHNLYNSMAAALAATLCGVSPAQVRRALADFQAVEHRLERVAVIDGVTWVNDSKATNVNSTFYALGSMTQPTVLILGGKDKGNDYTEIEQLVRDKVAAIVCMGVDNSKLLAFFDGKVPTLVDTHSIEDAVDACRRLARPGMTVLLSPCCASFDLFKSYEDRGRQFKALVKSAEPAPNPESSPSLESSTNPS